MKVTCDLKELITSQTNLGRAIGITAQRINDLIGEGVVIRAENDRSGGVMLFESLKNYYLSKKTNDGVDYWKEKGLHERIKRHLAELKLQKEEGKLYEAATVEMAMIEQLTMLRTRLYGIPSKIAPQLEGKNKGEIYEMLQREVEEALSELSNYNAEMINGAETNEKQKAVT